MSEYRYTHHDREEQLRELIASLPALVEHLRRESQFAALVPQYEAALEMARALLANGFNQEQLSVLGRSVPDVFARHRDWFPPAVQQEDGSGVEEKWFTELEAALQPALRAAGILWVVGYY